MTTVPRSTASDFRPVDERPPVESYPEALRNCFAFAYSMGQDVWTAEPAMRRARTLLAAHLSDRSFVLDIGSGRGVDARMLAEGGHSVVGLDVSVMPDQLNRVVGTSFVVGGTDCLVARATFDAVLDNGCLHHQHPDRVEAYLASLVTLLRPSGLFVLSVFGTTLDAPVRQMSPRGRLNNQIPAHELVALVERAGLGILEEENVPRLDGRSYRIVVMLKTGHQSG